MGSHIHIVSENEDLRQGDIICRKINSRTDAIQFGMIINADCDIAQSRNSGHITWVEIISAKNYIDRIWSWNKAQKILEKQTKPVVQQVNSKIQKQNPQLNDISIEDFYEWIIENGAEDLFSKIGINNISLKKQIEAVEIILKTHRENFNFDKLLKFSAPFGKKKEDLIKDSRDELGKTAAFPDFMFIPGLPDSMESGYVILLRNIIGEKRENIYNSYSDLLINDAPEAFYRTGRFENSLRFQIVQKLSFLFIRIGSNEAYEGDCEAALDLMTEELMQTNNEKDE